MTPETKLKLSIQKYLKTLGPDLWQFKVHGSAFQMAGVPDFVGCYRGKFIGIEGKSEKGKLSDKQVHEINRIRKAGGAVCVAYSLEQVKGFFEAL
jgi:penicillin-binding protein-related factor A (putative recombinase)